MAIGGCQLSHYQPSLLSCCGTSMQSGYIALTVASDAIR